MLNFPLNCIVKSESSWTCNVFEFNRVNISGVYIDYDDFLGMDVLPFTEYSFRVYQKSKKIMVSSNNETEYLYCALNFNYSSWKCLLCKKVSSYSSANCFCKTYSSCWSPIDGTVTGLLFSNTMEFDYHFAQDSLNIII